MTERSGESDAAHALDTSEGREASSSPLATTRAESADLTDSGVPASDSTAAVVPGSAKRSGGFWIDLVLRNIMVIILIGVLVAARLSYSRFFSAINLQLIFTQNVELGLIALGMTFVIISGAFDLSVVSTFALCGVVFTRVANSNPTFVAVVVALLIAVLIGILNGALVAKVQVNSFIATLATGGILGGVITVYLGTSTAVLVPAKGNTFSSDLIGLPFPIFLLILLFLVGQVLLALTTYGRSIMSIGGNEQASKLAGLPVTRLRISAFVLCGVMAAIAGILFAMQVGTMDGTTVQQESPLLLNAIAIVVVGGTSLFGGRGSVWRTAVGLVIFASLSNVFTSLAVSSAFAAIVLGLVLIIAVAADSYARLRENR